MRFTVSTAAFLALASRVLAQTDGFDAMTKPTKGEVINAGSTFEITWDYNAQYDGTISITLLEGDTPTTLELGDTFASGIDNSAGSYSWAVDSSLGDDATYGLKISLDSNSTIFQYSFPFSIAASSGGSSGVSTSTSAISTSAPPSSTSVETTSTPATHSTISSAAPTTEATTSSETSPSETSATEAVSSETSAPTVTSTGVTKSAATTGVTKTTLSSVVSASSTGSGSATTSSSAPVVTAGAGKVVAGTFAAMGGLAAAMLAL